MKKKLIILGSILALIVVILLWWFSDTQVLKRQTQNLTQAFSIAASDKNASRLIKNHTLIGMLAEEVSCKIDTKEFQYELDRGGFIAAHQMAIQELKSCAANISDINTSINGNTATTRAKLDLNATTSRGETHQESTIVTLNWKKNGEGQWKITLVKVLPQT